MKMNEIKADAGSRRKKMRVGRGNGSGKGTYAGKGGKGQTARTGGSIRPGFEGGQTPLHRRMPKLGGFKNPRRIEYAPVNVSTLNTAFKDGETVTPETLVEKKVLRKAMPVKILGTGDLTIALTVKVDKVSKSAADKITQAKGKVE